MATKKENFDLIEAFFDGELTKEEEKSFERKLREDPEFAREFKFRKDIKKHLKDANEYQSTKENVKGILNQKNNIFLNTKTYFAIAASIIVMLGIYFLITLTGNDNKDELITEQENDSTYFLKPQIDKLETKADIHFYDGISDYKIVPGQLIEINYPESKPPDDYEDTVRFHAESYMSVKTNMLFVFNPDGTIDTLSYTTQDIISTGKYMYFNDSLINGEVYWYLQSVEKEGEDLLILTDSLRIDLKD